MFDSVIDHGEKFRDYKKRKAAKFHEANQQRDSFKVAGAGLITKEQVRAIAHIKPDHLHKAAANIENNRDDIHDMIGKQLSIYPEFKKRGLSAVRDILQGDNAFDPKNEAEDADFTEDDYKAAEKASSEQKKGKKKKSILKRMKKGVKKKVKRALRDSKKQKDGKAMLITIVKYSMIGAGIGLLALSAGPIAMIIGRGLLELSEDIRSMAASSEDDDSKTIDDVISLTVDYLRHVDLKDLQDTSREAFVSLSSSRFNLSSLYDYVDPLVAKRDSGLYDMKCPYDILLDHVSHFLYENDLVESVRSRGDTVQFVCNSNSDHQFVNITRYPLTGMVRFELKDPYSEKSPDPSDERSHTTSIKNAPTERSLTLRTKV